MSKYLPAVFGISVLLIAPIAFAKERSELEKSTIKAATDCVAAAALNNPDIIRLYQENELKKVTDWIVRKSSACDNSLRTMRLLHDRLYGEGSGRRFLLGDYLDDLPRAVRERIRNDVERRIARESGDDQKSIRQQFVNHNDSLMLMEIGDTSQGTSQVRIYYDTPSEKMSSLVAPGTLFFGGTLAWETGLVSGAARIYKVGCPPLEYDVTGVFKGQVDSGILELQGAAPTYGDDCFNAGYAFDHNSRLKFEPVSATRGKLRRRWLREQR
jgi:hypothetical protein